METVEEVEGFTDIEELGVVSEDTHGQIFGFTWDGSAMGRRYP